MSLKRDGDIVVSVVTPCYNEEENVNELYSKVKSAIGSIDGVTYEHIFIDNDSTDRTVEILKGVASVDSRVKIIVNSRNFGHMCSPVHGILQASGDVVVSLVADLQDPPEMIAEFIGKWREGSDIVLGVKRESAESSLMFSIRKVYYNVLDRMSDVKIIKNYTGFGLYDRKVVEAVRRLGDPYPFFRGMIAEVGYGLERIEYSQPKREKGYTKNNFYTLYDIGILGIINNSKIPLRLAIFIGFSSGLISAMIGIGYFFMKLLNWDTMTLGVAPLLIMSSFMFSLLLFFVGIIGEYIGAIYTHVQNRPLVFEKERINFD